MKLKFVVLMSVLALASGCQEVCDKTKANTVHADGLKLSVPGKYLPVFFMNRKDTIQPSDETKRCLHPGDENSVASITFSAASMSVIEESVEGFPKGMLQLNIYFSKSDRYGWRLNLYNDSGSASLIEHLCSPSDGRESCSAVGMSNNGNMVYQLSFFTKSVDEDRWPRHFYAKREWKALSQSVGEFIDGLILK